MSEIKEFFQSLVKAGTIPQEPMNYDAATLKIYIDHLEAENAAMRERLEKAITPEFKIYEDIYFIDYVNEKGYSDYTTGKLKIREAFITCVSQTSQTEFLYRLQPKDLPQEILNDSTIHDEWWNWRSFYAKEIFKTRKAAEARLAELKGEKE